MIRKKEVILQEKTKELYTHVKTYLDDMDNLSDTSDFTVDNIEKMWGALEDNAKQIIREINEDMISAANEKELVKVKKKNMPKKE